jgi:hypothetical protein
MLWTILVILLVLWLLGFGLGVGGGTSLIQSLAGGSCDRLGVQPGRWPTTDGPELCARRKTHRGGFFAGD